MVVLDTSVLIDHLRCQKTKKHSFLERYIHNNQNQDFAVSVISIQELFQGKSSAHSSQEQAIFSLLNELNELPYTNKTAILAGKTVRDSQVTISFQDAAIAATAVFHKAGLLTLNPKDFRTIPDLKMV